MKLARGQIDSHCPIIDLFSERGMGIVYRTRYSFLKEIFPLTKV